jgi:hydroxyquinol 1,2-dioxygenase
MDGSTPEQGLVEAFAERVAGAAQARRIVAAISHLHALVCETGATGDDLRQAIDFLTDVGHATDARRQEWVLLADVTGVSTLIEDQSAPRPVGATPNTVAGPFYRADAPDCADGADICRDGRGAPLAVQGHVSALDGTPVAGALVEVWQANGDGVYENQDPDTLPDFNLRGRFRTRSDGGFAFRSVKPKGYALPADGPVGRLMAGMGYVMERPAHLHFRVMAAGYQRLTTHVFDAADPAITRDALFGVKPALLGTFRPEGPGWALDVRFVLVADHA